MFGSFETQLYLPSSDMDVVVFCSAPNNRTTLNTLAKALKEHDLVFESSLRVIAARVPIVKFIENVTQFSIDISFNSESGPRAATVMKQLSAQHPAMRYVPQSPLIIRELVLSFLIISSSLS